MKLLIDTHYLLWMFMDTAKISGKVKTALTSADNEVYYSQASLWEISIKYSIGKLFLNGITPEELYTEIENSFLICKMLKNQDLISSYHLPREHKDPFDRMIIWQAIAGKMTLLSVDAKMNRYVESGLKLFDY
ncbi:MAG: type II toxin-antitoxin system VapC family toxin [Butyrivibrio sp.]|nr:type II toxin-antitoxin system VapC family toxin [Muribaculum sp.]MCM1552323.1 type II toxin-antitoxin system VapC family toxin [Butyrivibrio sp.]